MKRQALIALASTFAVGALAGYLTPRSAPSPEAPPTEKSRLDGPLVPTPAASRSLRSSPPITSAELEGVFQDFQKSGSELEDMQRLGALGNRLADSDLPALLADVLKSPLGPARQAALPFLLNAYARGNPDAAMALAQTLPEGQEKTSVINALVASISSRDPALALSLAGTIPNASLRNAAMSSAVGAWASKDFPAALGYAVATEDPTLRADILRTMASHASGNQGALFDAVLEHMPSGSNFQRAVAGLFSSWARENPTQAAQALSQIPSGYVQTLATSQVVTAWAESTTDKNQVLEWTRTLPEGEAKRAALRKVFESWSQSAPTQALQALSSLPAAERSQALESIARGWSRTAPQEVLKWATQLGNPEERASAIAPAIAEWTTFAPEKAAQYVSSLPASEQGAAMRALVSRWASKDTGSAAAWLARQPVSAERDAAVEGITRQIAAEDPETALGWTASISDTTRRNRSTERLVRDWMRHDPVSARAWLAKSSLPPETRDRLMR